VLGDVETGLLFLVRGAQALGDHLCDGWDEQARREREGANGDGGNVETSWKWCSAPLRKRKV